MELASLRLSYEGNLAIVTLDSPPVNTITPQFVDDLEAAFDELAKVVQEKDIRCVLIASAIEKIFVAGADINQFTTWKKPDGMKVTRRGHDVFLKIADFEKPVIAVVNAGAFGGGLELALACDMRVIDPGAKVGLPETGLGIIPGYGGTQRLPRVVGASMAKKLVLTGRPVGGEEAYRIGLADVLSEPGESLAAAKKLAGQICAQAPKAISAAKRCVDYAMANDLASGIDYEISQMGDLCETEDKTEGAQAFLGKRKPEFKNK